MIEGDMVEHKTDRVYLRPHVPYPHDIVSFKSLYLFFMGLFIIWAIHDSDFNCTF